MVDPILRFYRSRDLYRFWRWGFVCECSHSVSSTVRPPKLTLLDFFLLLRRCVAKPDRSLGLGIHRMFSHCGFIVGPVLIGAVIDLSCVLWSSNCGKRGSCWVYDNEKMAYYVLIVTEAVFTLACICFFVSWWCFKKEMEVAIDECDTVHPPSMNNDVSTGERKEEEKNKKAWSDDTDQSAMEY